MAVEIQDAQRDIMAVNSDGTINVKLYGITSASVLLPIKVEDDGSGLGKIVTVPE